MRSLFHRIYQDFFMPSRIGVYEDLLRRSLDAGYIHLTLTDYYRRLNADTLDASQKYFLHRHDIDTDLKTTRRWFDVEQKLGVNTTYYFRLLTMDYGLMRELHAAGSEVGYHFEELAQYCKDHHITTTEKARASLEPAKKKFIENFHRVEDAFGHKMTSVASHGDFVNRKLKVINNEFVDAELLQSLGLEFEAYDQKLVSSFGFITSDKPYPVVYAPHDPAQHLDKNIRIMYMLSHPRYWHVNWGANIAESWRRINEGRKFR